MKKPTNTRKTIKLAASKTIVTAVMGIVLVNARSLGVFSIQVPASLPSSKQTPLDTTSQSSGSTANTVQESTSLAPTAESSTTATTQTTQVPSGPPKPSASNKTTNTAAQPTASISPTTNTTSGTRSGGTSTTTPPAPAPKPTPTPTPTPAPTPTPTPTYTYKNGTYYAEGPHSTPSGTEKIGISITINNDIITATSATNLAANGTSRAYQTDFIANYSSKVVGKPVSGLSLGKISGASLTPNGFNAALTAIRAQAK